MAPPKRSKAPRTIPCSNTRSKSPRSFRTILTWPTCCRKSDRAAGASTRATLSIYLKPRSQRPQVDQVIQELRPKLAAVPGMTVFLRNDPPIRIGGIQSKALYQFTLQAPKHCRTLRRLAGFSGEDAATLPGLEDVTSDLQIKNPQINVVIDRDKSSALGVTANQVEDALYSAYGLRQVSTIFAPNNQYRVILETEPQYQRDANALSSLYVRSKSGQLVPLNAVAKLTNTFGPLSVNHLGQLPAVTMSFNLKPGTSIGDAVNEINDLARRSLPATISTTLPGQRAGVPVLAVRIGNAAADGHPGDLYRAGNSV